MFLGTVTDGEFCLLRSRGETRALHLCQLIHDARESVQKLSKRTLLEMLILIDSKLNRCKSQCVVTEAHIVCLRLTYWTEGFNSCVLLTDIRVLNPDKQNCDYEMLFSYGDVKKHRLRNLNLLCSAKLISYFSEVIVCSFFSWA